MKTPATLAFALLALSACGEQQKPYQPPMPQSDPAPAKLFQDQREALDKAKEVGQLLDQAAKQREEATANPAK